MSSSLGDAVLSHHTLNPAPLAHYNRDEVEVRHPCHMGSQGNTHAKRAGGEDGVVDDGSFGLGSPPPSPGPGSPLTYRCRWFPAMSVACVEFGVCHTVQHILSLCNPSQMPVVIFFLLQKHVCICARESRKSSTPFRLAA